MPKAKMCFHCGRMVPLETKICPTCGRDEFIIVELDPSREEKNA